MTEPLSAVAVVPAATPTSLPALTVVGLSIRTHNAEASTTIPALWARVRESLFGQRPHDALLDPGALIAAYGEYESDHTGAYTLTVGFPVPRDHAVAHGLHRVDVAAADYARYDVTVAGPAGIFGAWSRAWNDRGIVRAFTTDLEVYPADFAEGGLPALCIARR